MTYQTHTLSNGIRLVHKQTDSLVAHCGLTINAGSRDEQKNEQGLAHFIEHLIFKGTHKRRAHHILSHMENVGGEINAYTAKEDTCIYASFMHKQYGRCMDLISDIVFRSVFPPKEIQKEKDVVLDEINSYRDNPSERIFDEFDNVIFYDHPLGTNILGVPKTLKKFSQENIYDFMEKNYVTHEMVLASVGKTDFKKLIYLAEKYFGEFAEKKKLIPRQKFTQYTARNITVKRRNHQVHCMMGNEAYHVDHPRKTSLILLNNILGGPGMNSRLNMGIREKYGFCYNLESHYQPYSDTGLFSIYLGTDKGYIDKTIELVHKELALLRNKPLGILQLGRAKMQLQGQVAISLESNLNEMLSIGKSILMYDKIDTIEQINEKIEKVTAMDLMETAHEIFDTGKLSMLLYKP